MVTMKLKAKINFIVNINLLILYLMQPYHRNNEELWLESKNLAFQEGLESKSAELTSSTIKSTRGSI